jgi:hypothetical protein
MLHAQKLVAMQRLQSAARSYSHHTHGVTTAQKYAALEKKFHGAYGCEDSPSSKTRAKKKGFAVTDLIAWQQSPERVHWWLLATTGKGRVWEWEKLVPIGQERIQAAGGYELVNDGRTWSWKYRESHIQSLRASIHQAITRKHDDRLRQLIEAIFSTAGFRLARQQAGHLVAYIRADWLRVRGRNEEMPPFPTRMLYVRALANAPAEKVVQGVSALPTQPPQLAAEAVVPAEQGGEAGAVSVPVHEIRNGTDTVVASAHVPTEMDWLAELIDEADRDHKS